MKSSMQYLLDEVNTLKKDYSGHSVTWEVLGNMIELSMAKEADDKEKLWQEQQEPHLQ